MLKGIVFFTITAMCLLFSMASFASDITRISSSMHLGKSAVDVNMHDLSQMIFIGSFALLISISATWSWATRSLTTAFTSLYFLTSGLFLLSDGGISITLMLSDNLIIHELERVVVNVVSFIALIWFSINFFNLKYNDALSYLMLKRFSGLLLLAIPLSYFVSEQGIWLVNQLISSLTLIALIVSTRSLTKIKNRLANFYSLTMIIQLLINIALYFLHYWQYSSEFTHDFTIYAYCLMAIMITYLLGRKTHIALQDKHGQLQSALHNEKSSQAAQQQLLTAQQESQELLESRVQERTLELNITLQELEEANQELQEKNTLDELSGLYNRRHYDQKILAEYRRSRRNLTPLSLVLVDIDHFKKVNDTYGHLIGDKCIVQTASIIKQLLRRSSDVGCRYGGEEFCLILPETDKDGALALAEEVRLAICASPMECDESRIELTVSCGITTYKQEKGKTPEDIFSSADSALYQAKHAGRNQVKINSLCKI
jgi:diguanylate cyclase (GGDEF)-like protein